MWTRITPNKDTFHAVLNIDYFRKKIIHKMFDRDLNTSLDTNPVITYR